MGDKITKKKLVLQEKGFVLGDRQSENPGRPLLPARLR